MEQLNIDKFSPTKAELLKLVEESKPLGLTDLADQAQLRKIKDARLTLRSTRTAIAKRGKELREDALAFQRKVISVEKELLAIIAPEEKRLEALEDKAQEAVERQARVELLPRRRERLAAIGDGIEVADEILLDMDGPAFEGYLNKRFSEKNQKDREAIEARDKALREEEEAQRREHEIHEREEQARREERERLEREHQEAHERALRETEEIERQEREERERRDREAKEKLEREEAERKAFEEQVKRDEEDRERKEREETERLERETRYQDFLKKHGYTGSDADKQQFHFEKTVDEVRLYKLAGVLKIK